MRQNIRIDFTGGLGRRGKVKVVKELSASEREVSFAEVLGKRLRLMSIGVKEEGMTKSIFLELEE